MDQKKSFHKNRISFHDLAAHLVVERAISAAKPILMEPSPMPALPLGETDSFQPSQSWSFVRSNSAYQPQASQPAAETIRPIGTVAIIGAGVSGLYTAMILDSLDISYEILEANDRIGGRIYTHRFNGEEGKNAPVGDPARYDYFDVGAMRYPNIPFMRRVFRLFDDIEITPLLLDYDLSNNKNFMYFNDSHHTVNTSSQTTDPFSIGEPKGTVPEAYLKKQDGKPHTPEEEKMDGVEYWTHVTYKCFKEKFAEIKEAEESRRLDLFAVAWDELTKQDHFSTRGYMLAGSAGKPPGAPAPFPEPVVQWLESFDSATGLYDQGFVESVLVCKIWSLSFRLLISLL